MKHLLPCRETQCGRRAIYRTRRRKRWLTRRSPPCGRRWAWSARRGRGSCLTSCCPVLTTRTTTRLSSTSLTPLRRPVWISTWYVCKPTDDPVPDRGTCAHDRRALQQIAVNVHVKHSDLTRPHHR